MGGEGRRLVGRRRRAPGRRRGGAGATTAAANAAAATGRVPPAMLRTTSPWASSWRHVSVIVRPVDAEGLGQLAVVERRPVGDQVLDDAVSQR